MAAVTYRDTYQRVHRHHGGTYDCLSVRHIEEEASGTFFLEVLYTRASDSLLAINANANVRGVDFH